MGPPFIPLTPKLKVPHNLFCPPPSSAWQIRWPQSTISVLRTHFSVLLTPFSVLRAICSLLLTPFSVLCTICSLLLTFCSLLRTRTPGRRTFITLRHEPPGPPLQAPCHGNIRFSTSLKACFAIVFFLKFETGSKLDIYPYLFNHHYVFQQP